MKSSLWTIVCDNECFSNTISDSATGSWDKLVDVLDIDSKHGWIELIEQAASGYYKAVPCEVKEVQS